jgi:hypothetical protein
MSRDSGIVTRIRAGQLRNSGSVLGGTRDLSPSVQDGSGDTPSLLLGGVVTSSPGEKRSRREANSLVSI